MLAAAKAAAIKLTPEELEQDSILPQVDRIRCVCRLMLEDYLLPNAVASCISIASSFQVTKAPGTKLIF